MKDKVNTVKEHLDEIEKEFAKSKPNKEKMFDFFEALWFEIGEIEMDIVGEDRFCPLCGYGRAVGRPWPAPPRRSRIRNLPRRFGPGVIDGD